MDENPDAAERYSTKLIKYAWRSTWHFSKQQIIFSSILGLIAAPIAMRLARTIDRNEHPRCPHRDGGRISSCSPLQPYADTGSHPRRATTGD